MSEEPIEEKFNISEEKVEIENCIFPDEPFDFDLGPESPPPKRKRRKRRKTSNVFVNGKKSVVTKQLRTRTIYARVKNSAKLLAEENKFDDENDYEVTEKRKTTISKLTLETKELEEVFVKRRRYRRNTFHPRSRESVGAPNGLPWTLAGLTLFMSDNRTALEFCQSKKLLPLSKQCPVCHEQMLFSEKLSSDKGLGYVFRCSRRACQIVRSARSGTWFEKSKLPIRKSLLLTYCFATNFPFSLAVHESSFTAGCTSPTTVLDWYSYCREVCIDAMSRQMSVKLGGEFRVVEMGEIIIGGKPVKKQVVQGQAILGFYCRTSDRVSIACIPRNKREAGVLIPIIEDFIAPGTIIHITCWNPEEVLGPGYMHLITNCNMRFSAPENGVRNVGMDKIWRMLKAYVPQIENGKKPDQLYDYLCEFLWRRWVDLNRLDPFEAFLTDAAVLYTLPEEDYFPFESHTSTELPQLPC